MMKTHKLRHTFHTGPCSSLTTALCLLGLIFFGGRLGLRVNAGQAGAPFSDVFLRPSERRTSEATGTNDISISGKVLTIDGSPQVAIVIEALRVEEPSSVALPLRASAGGAGAGGSRIPSMLPKPEHSATTLTDTNGVFEFVNLRPGRYRLRGHGMEEFIFPEGSQGTDISGSPLIDVQPGRSRQEIRFVVPEVKKGVWKNHAIIQGLSEVNPMCIHRTPDGLLWIGTEQSFLYAYDGSEFKAVASAPEIAANEILSLEHTSDGALWIGTAAGLNRHAGGKTPRLPLGEKYGRPTVNDILADSDGTVWLATNSGLFRYDGRNFVSFGTEGGLPGDKIYSLMRARDGALWMATSKGLVRFESGEFTLLQSFGVFKQGSAAHLHQARDGSIWIADVGGVYRYDGNRFSRLGVEDGLSNDIIDDIAETSDGAIWLATKIGLSRFNGTTIVNYREGDGLSNQWVRDIFVDADDVLWCANGWGVSRFDPKGFVRFGQKDGLNHGNGGAVEVFATEAQPDGSIWIGTGWRGVFRGDGKKFEPAAPDLSECYVRQIHRAADGTLWFAANSGLFKRERGQVVRVLERSWVIALSSDSEGNLWYGRGWNGGGLYRFDPRSGAETVFGAAEGLPNDQVWAVAADSDGGVWVGTTAGLARYREGKIEDFRERLGVATGAVFDLRRDSDDVLWIGSRLGLHRWNGNERISITVTNGLPDQHIWCSARTSDGKIWMGTDRYGLLGYDGKAVTVLDKRDGMLGNTVIAIAATDDDTLWVGHRDGGVVRYEPSRMRPSIRLRGVRVDEQTLTNVLQIPKIMIGRRVTFQYQEIDHKTHPEKRQFWCRLANHSGETVFAAVTKGRHFDWVPEKRGSYTFEVQAIDRDLNYSEPARVMMQVIVPWHANAWILTPVVGAFGGLLVWAFVSRVLYLRKNREAVLLRERVRIARDLHDHLGAGLTHVSMLGDMVRQQASHSGAVELLAARLTESARDLTRTMGEVIWTTDPDKDTLESFVLFVTGYAERFFAETGPRLRFDMPSEIPGLTLPAELRSSLLTVTKEALNNVAKHADATEVRIELQIRGSELHLIFEDNGRGFVMSEMASERRGLINMQNRLRDLGGKLRIESVAGRGTRVHARLRLPRS